MRRHAAANEARKPASLAEPGRRGAPEPPALQAVAGAGRGEGAEATHATDDQPLLAGGDQVGLAVGALEDLVAEALHVSSRLVQGALGRDRPTRRRASQYRTWKVLPSWVAVLG